MHATSHKQTNGIGLIEVIISITVLAIGLLGLLQAFPTGTEAGKDIEFASIASYLAQSRLEELATLQYEDIAEGTLETDVHVNPDTNSPFYNFLRTTTVAYLDENLDPNVTDLGLKKITITITWPPVLDGDPQSTQLVTMISDR